MALRHFFKTYTFDGSDTSFDFTTFIITPASWGAGDSFKLAYNGSLTVAFVAGTNGTAAAIQAALRTLIGDSGLTVTGTTDTGPFTVNLPGNVDYVDFLAPAEETGCTAPVTATFQDVLTVLDADFGVTSHDLGADDDDTRGLVRIFSDRWPYLIRRIRTELVSGSGCTYEVKETDGGTELADESPANVHLDPPYATNSLTVSGAALEDGDVLELEVWYETAGDRRF